MSDDLDIIEPRANLAETRELTAHAFEKWWSCLDATDRDEFSYVYGGDRIMARFVCALDALMLVGSKVEKGDQSLFSLAYHIAARPYPDFATEYGTRECLAKGAAAWAHDSVQCLVERVRYRSTKRRKMRLENLLYEQVEEMIADAGKTDDHGFKMPMADRKAAMDVGVKLMAMAADEDALVRAERSKVGLALAAKARNDAEEETDPRTLSVMVKSIIKKLPADERRKLLDALAPKPTIDVPRE